MYFLMAVCMVLRRYSEVTNFSSGYGNSQSKILASLIVVFIMAADPELREVVTGLIPALGN
jgi:hypothetical protein